MPLVDLTTTLNNQINSDISGLSPGGITQAMYTSPGVRNPSLFVPGTVDITCISQTSGTAPGAVLIDPSFAGMANHYGWDNPAEVFTLTFYGSDGSTNTSTFTADTATSTQIGTTDIRIVKLSSPMPSTVKPILIPPADWRNYAPNLQLPAIYTNQEKTLNIGLLSRATPGSFIDIIQQPNAPLSDWYADVITGDSGNPVALIVNGVLNLLTAWEGSAAGPSYPDNISAIQSFVTANGGGTIGIADWSDTFRPAGV